MLREIAQSIPDSTIRFKLGTLKEVLDIPVTGERELKSAPVAARNDENTLAMLWNAKAGGIDHLPHWLVLGADIAIDLLKPFENATEPLVFPLVGQPVDVLEHQHPWLCIPDDAKICRKSVCSRIV